MIKIVLKGNDQAELLSNVSFDNVKDSIYFTPTGEWLDISDYIIPTDQIRYIENMGDDDDEEQD